MPEKKLNNEETIALLDVYLNEFIFRDDLLWAQTFKLFYATIIVMLLPNITEFLNVSLPALPTILFRAVGGIMSLAFLYVAIGYGKRLEASTKTYNKTLEMLDAEYQRIKIKDLKHGKFFTWRTSYIVIFQMFFSLIVMDILFIIYGW